MECFGFHEQKPAKRQASTETIGPPSLLLPVTEGGEDDRTRNRTKDPKEIITTKYTSDPVSPRSVTWPIVSTDESKYNGVWEFPMQYRDIFQQPQPDANFSDWVLTPSASQTGFGCGSDWTVPPDVELNSAGRVGSRILMRKSSQMIAAEDRATFQEPENWLDGTTWASPPKLASSELSLGPEDEVKTNKATITHRHDGKSSMNKKLSSNSSVVASKRVADNTLNKDLRKRSRKKTSKRGSEEGDVEASDDDDSRAGASRDDGVLGFACPFYRRDPRMYRECMYRKLTRIRDVKQHIQRRHTPASSCPVCYATFSSMEEGNEHIRARDCQLRDPGSLDCVKGISMKAQEQLKHRVDRTVTAEQQWYEVWDILFKGVPRPQAAYLGTVLEETVRMMRNFWKQEGVQAGTEFLQSQGVSFGCVRDVEKLMVGLFDHVHTQFELQTRQQNSVDSCSEAPMSRTGSRTVKSEITPASDLNSASVSQSDDSILLDEFVSDWGNATLKVPSQDWGSPSNGSASLANSLILEQPVLSPVIDAIAINDEDFKSSLTFSNWK